jgi:hypothetical protein
MILYRYITQYYDDEKVYLHNIIIIHMKRASQVHCSCKYNPEESVFTMDFFLG